MIGARTTGPHRTHAEEDSERGRLEASGRRHPPRRRLRRLLRTRAEAAAGFSLIEMLVVVTIIALVAALALPLLARPSDSVRLQATARDLVSALRITRAAAIARSTDLALTIDVESRTFESPAVAPRAYAADIFAQLKIADLERASRSRGGFRFFADGSSTGGDVTLQLGDKAERVCVDWLTGEARQGASC